ncbi:MAG: hemerythrin domain-containing protein [Bacteroidota bacterium]
MKRNENIQPLSRDHHFGLLFCWKIRKGLANQTELERINKYVNYFWQSNLQQHFLEEETILFNKLNDKLCDDGRKEHLEIALQIAKVNNQKNQEPQAYADLADLVDQHIRFEERILFPHLEKVFSDNQLKIIGLELQKLHQETIADDYPDSFWD